jgi:hypothetical protein
VKTHAKTEGVAGDPFQPRGCPLKRLTVHREDGTEMETFTDSVFREPGQ